MVSDLLQALSGQRQDPSTDLSSLMHPVHVVAPTVSCADIDEAFRTNADLTCLAVSPEKGADLQQWGLISRGSFMSTMAGRLGYGRSVHAHRPIATLANWQALVLAESTTVEQAARRLLARDRDFRYSEVLVRTAVDHHTRSADVAHIGGLEGKADVMAYVEVEDVLRALTLRLAHKALSDELTGLCNREHFLAQLGWACTPPQAEAPTKEPTGEPRAVPTSHSTDLALSTTPPPMGALAVIYVDIDDFKTLNDSYGHNTGDQVLREVARRLRRVVRPHDVVARLGGDEFAILLLAPAGTSRNAPSAAAPAADAACAAGGHPDVDLDGPKGHQAPAAISPGTDGQVIAQPPVCSPHLFPQQSARDVQEASPAATEHAAQWAERLGQRLLQELTRPLHLGGRVLPGRASIGIALKPASTQAPLEPEALLHEADLAMYRAKAAGGSRLALAATTATTVHHGGYAPDRDDLHGAVARGEFVLHYQPIVDLVTGRLTSTEALVRWQHPHRGLLAPAAFLGDVAAAGFAADLDAHVLRSALTQQARWMAETGPKAPAHLNVNLSVPALLRPDLAELVLRELAGAAAAAQVLRLELPEVATAEHLAQAGPALAALRAAGVGLVLDDVGSGAAGLAHLSRLHLDGIKIDRRFVAGMLDDERDAAVVAMLVHMGAALGLEVTAEGVETPALLTALRHLAHAHPTARMRVQGYATGRPVPATQALGHPQLALGAD